jgi:hypothetical protein
MVVDLGFTTAAGAHSTMSDSSEIARNKQMYINKLVAFPQPRFSIVSYGFPVFIGTV